MLYIYTLTWNKKELLVRLKNSLLPALKDLNYKWYIKDNGSKDQTVEEIHSWNEQNIICLPYQNNLQSFSEGMNYIHEQAKPEETDQILFLNNDVIINSEDSIKNMLNLLKSDESIGVVGARLLYTNTNKIQHCGVVIHHYKTPTHLRVGQQTSDFDKHNREYQSVTGAVMLVNVKDFNKVNGFNNKYKWAFEDIDLNLKIKYNLGKKIVYCGNTDIFHDESSSLKQNPINKLFMSHNTNVFKEAWANIITVDIDKYTKKYNLYK